MINISGSAGEAIAIYTPSEFPFDRIQPDPVGKRTGSAKRRFMRQVAAFDIETTSYIDHGEVRRAMFCWQFSYNNEMLCFGRTAEEMQTFFVSLSESIPSNMLTICVHNLSYEFNFCYQLLSEALGDCKCFFLDSRRIAKMRFDNLNFVDTYILCPMSLERISADYDLTYKKAAGDLDYNKLFNVRDPLSDQELFYCIQDVRSLVDYYQTEMRLRGYDPSNMPMTKTALVRVPLRRAARYALYNGRSYPDWIQSIQNSYKVFCMLEWGFQGGYTAINAGVRNCTIRGEIRCKDFTSSYPAWCLAEYFPVSRYDLLSETLNLSDPEDRRLFIKALKNKCCLFWVEFHEIRLKADKVSPIIAGSKCLVLDEPTRLNGKIAYAKRLRKVVNEIELADILKFYDVGSMAVSDVYIADRGPLPEFIRDKIKQLFKDKTQLKGEAGKELEYLLSKADLNSIYGMMAMNPIRQALDLIPEEMKSAAPDLSEEDREKLYYKSVRSRNNFLSYAWGMYVTTWARHHLFEAMEICGENWLYSDTDSVYYLSTPEIEAAFDTFNASITAGAFYAVNEKSGKRSTLGEMTPDGEYIAFRGLGAKKYALVKPDGSLKITVAGVPKNKASAGTLPDIDHFKAGHIFAGKVTGKLRPEYHPAPIRREIVNGVEQTTASYINLLPCDYILNNSRFEDFVNIL